MWGLRAIAACTAALLWPPGPSRAADVRLPGLEFRVHLAGESVQALAQTRDGYLWFGTPAGLVRYDGARTTVYEVGPPPAPVPAAVTALFVDRWGTLWIGSEGAGLTRRGSDGTFVPVSDLGAPGAVTVHSIAEARDGTLWVATEAGIYRFHHGQWRHDTVERGLPSDAVTALVPRGDDVVWAETSAGDVAWTGGRYEPLGRGEGPAAKLRWSPHLAHVLERASPAVATGGAWDAYRGQRVRAAVVDRRGEIWVARPGEGGLLHVTPAKRATYTTGDGLGGNAVTSLLVDDEGGLWVGTRAAGVTEIRRRSFTTLDARDGLPGNDVRAVASGHDGSVWVAGPEGLAHIRGDKLQVWATNKALPIAPTMLAVESTGVVWMAGRSGPFVRFAGKTATSVPMPAAAAPSALAVDAQDVLWAAFADGSVIRWKDDVALTVRQPAPGCQAQGKAQPCAVAFVAAAARDEGGVYMAAAETGVHVLEQDKLRQVVPAARTQALRLFSLFEDRAGDLWLGTSGGLARAVGDAPSVAVAGAPFVNVHAITEDGAGRLWLGSDAGVFAVARPQGAGPAHSVAYTARDGLRTNVVARAFGPQVARSADGRLWFATPHGLLVFEAPEGMPAPTAPRLVIEDVLVGGRRWQGGRRDQPRLPTGPTDALFRYASPRLSSPQRLRFRHRLRPEQHVWSAPTEERAIRYAAVAAGWHTFEVEAFADDAPANVTRTHVTFAVPSRFSDSLPFYIGCFLLLASALALGQRWLVRRLRQGPERTAKRRNDALAPASVHALSSALFALAMHLDAATAHAERLSSATLTRRLRGARKALAHGQWFVALLHKRRFFQRETAASFHDALAGLARLHGEAVVQVDVTGAPFSLPEVQDDLLQFAAAAVHDAVEVAAASHVSVGLCYLPERLELWVRHDGNDSGTSKGELKELASRANGRFVMHQALGVGAELGVVVARDAHIDTS